VIADFAAISEKPMVFSSLLSSKDKVITEFGCPASTRDQFGNAIEMPNNAEKQANYIESHWLSIAENPEIAQGGWVFAYTVLIFLGSSSHIFKDEWWKAGKMYEHNPSVAGNIAFPGGYWDEEWFGIMSIEPNGSVTTPPLERGPDILTPRAAYYRLGWLYGKLPVRFFHDEDSYE
jgi:hypothetical protein